MKCEFRKGDIIVQIGKDVSYVVVDAHTSRYSLNFYFRGGLVHTVLEKNYIDENYVKVDKCNPEDFAEVIDKLGDIWYNIHKGETR